MDIESVVMALLSLKEWFVKFVDKFDVGGCREVDEVIDSDYRYLTRISGIYPYLRGRYGFLGLAQVISYLAILAFVTYLLIDTAILVSSHDLNLTIQSVHLAILHFAGFLMIFSLNKNRKHITNAHLILRDNYYTYDDGLEIEELDSRSKHLRKIKIILVITFPTFLILTSFSILVLPIIEVYYGYERQEIDGLDMRLPIPLSHPYSKDSPVTFCLYLFATVVAASIVTITVATIDVLLLFVALTVVEQYKRLHKSIENLQLRAENIYRTRFPNQQVSDEKLLSCYNHCIKQNVEHHIKIETVFNNMVDAFYVTLGIAVLFGSVIIAASLLGFVIGEASPSLYISSSMLLVCETANMAMICYYGQQISDHSYDTVSALYNTNWNTAPKQVVTSILIMIEKSKRPLEAKALGIWPLNHEMFTSIINTSYSYINILLGAKARRRRR